MAVEVEAEVASFEMLGVVPLINAQGHITTLGGSLMPAPVVDAMARASRSFVQLNELHEKAGEHIARLIGAPAAFVCNGAASGMFLSGAAVLAGGDQERIRALPDTCGRPSECLLPPCPCFPFPLTPPEPASPNMPRTTPGKSTLWSNQTAVRWHGGSGCGGVSWSWSL